MPAHRYRTARCVEGVPPVAPRSEPLRPLVPCTGSGNGARLGTMKGNQSRGRQAGVRIAAVLAGIGAGCCAAAGGAAVVVEPGLPWVRYHDVAMTRVSGAGVDARLELDTGAATHDFAQFWRGHVRAPVAGTVTFRAEADDGVRLWIGGRLVIDGWSAAVREGTSVFADEGAWVPLRAAFFQNGGTARLALAWSWQGREPEPVPASALGHDEHDRRHVRRLAGTEPQPAAEDVPLSTAKALVYTPGRPPAAGGPLRLGKGPQLLLDDHLIEWSADVAREVIQPQRSDEIPNPVVTGAGDGCFQPYLSVIREPGDGRFRMWYSHHSRDRDFGAAHVAHLESDDGIRWNRPPRVLADPAPIVVGLSVVAEAAAQPPAGPRFTFAWHADGGLKVAQSDDGLAWVPLAPAPVIRHNHDINGIFLDAPRRRHLAIVSVYIPGPWAGRRRVTMQSHSTNLLDWSEPHHVLVPDPLLDEGETQFYALDGFLHRGDLLLGMAKVLRDDLKADDPPDPPDQYGIGHTTLAWTRDGETWVRDRTPFLKPDPRRGAWDHAHAWIDEQLPVGDLVHLYYAGYARGHKVQRFEERQIGVVTIRRDRYVARVAGAGGGRLTTPPLLLDGGRLTLNVDSRAGEARVAVLDPAGDPLPGFSWDDCQPITTDSLAAPVIWPKPLRSLAGQPVRLSFSLRSARLFAFDVE